MRSVLLVLTLIANFVICSDILMSDEIPQSVVKIHTTARYPDFVRPWAKRSAEEVTGSGAVIAGNKILTNAHVVRYASRLFVQFSQSSDRYPARVLCVSSGLDLAVIELEDNKPLEKIPALALSEGIPQAKKTVNVYGYPVGGNDLAVTEGIISRIEYSTFTGEEGGLRIQIDAALNPGNSGGPAILDGTIVGLVFSKINTAENTGYLIPSDEIRRFLVDAEDGTYDGKPSIYDECQTTENEALREKLSLSNQTTGMTVTRPASDDANYPLKTWDVITHIADQAIDNEGNVRIRDDLRLDYQYLIPQLAKDGQVPLSIWRNGSAQNVSIPVKNRPDLVLGTLEGTYPRYFVYGPMVFLPACRELFDAVGPRGVGYFLASDSPLLHRFRDRRRFPEEELVVFRLLTHRTTKGYDNPLFAVVSKVNGQEVLNLKQLVAVLRDLKDPFLTYEVAGRNELLVFRREEMEQVTDEVLDDEGIRNRGSSDIVEIWDAKSSPASSP
jgi:S1-C subfamily serine protease